MIMFVEVHLVNKPSTTTNNLTTAQSCMRPLELFTLLLHPNLFKAYPFSPFQKSPISLKPFLTTFSHPIWGQPAFILALDSLSRRISVGNISTFLCKMCPSNFILSLIIAIETGIKPNCWYSLLPWLPS